MLLSSLFSAPVCDPTFGCEWKEEVSKYLAALAVTVGRAWTGKAPATAVGAEAGERGRVS